MEAVVLHSSGELQLLPWQQGWPASMPQAMQIFVDAVVLQSIFAPMQLLPGWQHGAPTVPHEEQIFDALQPAVALEH